MTSRQLDEEAIFHIARDIGTPENRSTYLDQVCAGDAALRERVEFLLNVYETEQDFLKSNEQFGPTVDRSPIQEEPGQQIGRYRLLQRIGEGGFGVVYMAEQERPVRRKVALKVIKPGMDTHAVVARFEAERQALAMMDHPHIARVLDGGATDSGRPYFVMELVKGIPITEYCDKNQLSTKERLELFTTVCQSVQHAHQKGIIHRDLKPSNVLVTLADGRPIVKVIDFGVAKATNQQLTEKTLFTAYGQMVGTPQYMSPEQAEMSCLDVDTRSDVYSLGVVLYELLTGTTPLLAERLRTAGFAEMQRIIREEEPPKPSTRLSTSGDELTAIAKHRSVSPEKLKSQIEGDLDWIVMKALEKDRNRRYESASRLADDVVCFLSDRVIDARPPSTSYQLKKAFNRNKVLVGTLSTIFLTLVAGLGVALWGLKQARDSAVAAREQRDRYQSLLRDHEPLVLNEIFDNVFSGNMKAATQAIADANTVGVSSQRLAILRGIQQIFSGDQESYKKGIATFERMLETDQENVIALSMLVWAQAAGYADLDVFAKIGRQHRDLSEPEGEFEKVIWAAGLSVEGNFRGVSVDGEGIRSAKQALEGVVARNPSWKLPRLLLARVLSDYSVDTSDPQYVREAIDVHLPRIQVEDPDVLRSPFWLAQQLHIYSVGARLSADNQRTMFREKADRLAEFLVTLGHEDYILGRLERALYFTNAAEMDGAEDFSHAIDEWKVFLESCQNDLYGSLIGGLLIRVGLITGDMTEADRYYAQYPLSFAAYFRGDREETLALCSNLRPTETLLGRFWTHGALYACGHDERKEALGYFEQLEKDGDYPPWIELPLQLFLQRKNPEQVEQSESHVHRAFAQQVTGNYLVNVGEDEKALKHFERVIQADSFMMDVHQWAHAFRIRIQKDPDWYQRMTTLD